MTGATGTRVRGRCLHCGREFPLNRSGRVRGHRVELGRADSRWCTGAWTYPIGHANQGKM